MTKIVRAKESTPFIKKGQTYESMGEMMVPHPAGGEMRLYIIRLPDGRNTAVTELVVTPCRRSANLRSILDA